MARIQTVVTCYLNKEYDEANQVFDKIKTRQTAEDLKLWLNESKKPANQQVFFFLNYLKIHRTF